MKLLQGINNIIFDFGGVIIDIEFERVKEAFKKLGIENLDDHFSQFRQTRVFDHFDTGRVSEDEFFSEIGKHLASNVTREQVIGAWNSMLGRFSEEHFHFLMDMKERYNTYLLSNTNETHLRFYFRKLHEWFGINNMDVLFEKTYYSHVIHMRKPDISVFEYVCRDAGLAPAETLFIDDNLPNVEGARKAGLRAWHLQKPYSILDLDTMDLTQAGG